MPVAGYMYLGRQPSLHVNRTYTYILGTYIHYIHTLSTLYTHAYIQYTFGAIRVPNREPNTYWIPQDPVTRARVKLKLWGAK